MICIVSCATKCLYVISGFAVLVCLDLGSRKANIDCIVLSILLLVEVFCLGMLPVDDAWKLRSLCLDSEPTVSSCAGSRLGSASEQQGSVSRCSSPVSRFSGKMHVGLAVV